MGEGILKNLLKEKGITNITVSSAGTAANPEYRIYGDLAEVMQNAGIDFSNHISTQITEQIINKSDLIIVMEKRHKSFITTLFPRTKSKTFLLKELADDGEIEIEDPLGHPPPANKLKLKEIKDCIERSLTKILKFKCFT
ncbi:MAG: hypothetical protein JW983_08280 [Elusimicrobia bacterium]|nr:hypothetical protein [Elusimicrobiota bacterium]